MLKIREIKIRYQDDNVRALEDAILKKLRLTKGENFIDFKIAKKSIDARKKPDIYYVYEVMCSLDEKTEARLLRLNNKDIVKGQEIKYNFKPKGGARIKKEIIVVGSGPAGLFASYNLVKNGYPVIIVERGSEITKRIEKV